MTRPGNEDPTRRHTFVTAGLVAAAALVLVVQDEPSQRKDPGRGGAAAGTAAVAAGKALPPARGTSYRQFDASARLVIRPAVVGSTTPMLPRQK